MLSSLVQVFHGIGFLVFMVPFSAGRGVATLHRLLRFVLFFVGGVPSVAFDAQCSGPANSL